LKKDYDACVLAVGLIEPNSARAEGESKEGVHFGLPFLRDIGMGVSKVKLGARVAVIGGGNTAIDCAREALRQGAVEVTMITVEANPQEMPAVPEDLHDMKDDGDSGQRQSGSFAAASGEVCRRHQCFTDQH
jgi:NADPH-dependent glutamate synthase beta subunit-like oxidoreductase